MRLIFHGELREKFGESVDMACDSASDALEGYSRQVDWPKDFKVHVVAEGAKLQKESDFQNYYDEVHIVPAMTGGSGKFFNLVVGALLIVAGVLMLPNPIGWSLIISGTLMVLQGVIMLFMKAPKLNKNEDPEASKYLPVNRNTTAVNTPITMAWGRIDLAGHWLSLQSDSVNLSTGIFPTNPT